MTLALATLIYEWRRYLAAIIALAFSGVLVLVMIGLFAGIIHSALATTERSRADIFIMPIKTPTLVNGDPTLPARVQPQIYLNPHVVEVRSIEEAFGAWANAPAPGEKQVQKFVSIWAVDPVPNAVTLPTDYTEEQRLALMEPGAILVDASNLATLGVKLNGKGSINGHAVHVRGILHNYQDIDQTSVTASRETERKLSRSGGADTTDTGPLMVRIDNPANAMLVKDEINAAAHGAYHASTMAEFNQLNENALLQEQIIGVLLLFLTVMAVLIGVGITSQTLRGAILSNIREFASLRALGISMGSLRLIVMELSVWAGVAGVGLALLLTWLAAAAAGSVGLPLVIRPGPAIFISVLLMIIAVVSGAMAMGILKRSEPADLLR
jgi:putative ABC transport system permease protein